MMISDRDANVHVSETIINRRLLVCSIRKRIFPRSKYGEHKNTISYFCHSCCSYDELPLRRMDYSSRQKISK